MSDTEFTNADVCVIACAEAFRGDGEIMVSPMGLVPSIGARLARASFEPDLLLTDGVATIQAGNNPVGGSDAVPVTEGHMPFRRVFDTLWWGKRHVMMGASQIDRYGNQNIACIGEWQKPKAQLLGVRGAPGNTINHPTSYWVAKHSKRVFVDKVDMVSGVGYDRAREVGEAARFHEIRNIVTNLGVFDFATDDNRMRLRSVHPGVTVDDIVENTGFELVIPDQVEETRAPTADELSLIRDVIDPKGLRLKEVPG